MAMFFFLALTFVTALCQNNEDARCSRSSPPCEYTCHCESPSECPWYPRQPCATSGACARGWSGPTCQRENTALDSRNTDDGKPPIIGSSNHSEENHTALAFDDNTTTVFVTDQVQNPYLWVNLRRPRRVARIALYTTDPDLIAGFRVDASADSSFSKPRRCYTSSLTYKTTLYQFSCASGIEVGPYFRVLVPRTTRLVIAELLIYECADFWYGYNCELPCNCEIRNEVCNKYSGVCKSGCASGFYSTGCQTSCRDGWYGSDCAKLCGYCAGNELCDKRNGSCPHGCGRVGFKPPLCQEDSGCPVGRYGVDCSAKCGHCAGSGTCMRDSGSCPEGCDAGYTGVLCNLECPDGKFGQNCQQKCNCFDSNEACDSVTGRCQSGCDHGYHGDGCLSVCSPGKFGRDCSETCKCYRADEVCNHVTGVCLSGCADGHMGEGCSVVSDGDLTIHIGVVIAVGAVCLILAVIMVWAVVKWRQYVRLYQQKQKTKGYANHMGHVPSRERVSEVYDEIPQ